MPTQPLPEGTIHTLQTYIEAKIQDWGFADETLEQRLLLLTEEVGELAKACRKQMGIKNDVARVKEYNPGAEVVDVINMVFAVGIQLGVDIDAEFVKKYREVDARVYKHQD